MTRVHQTRLRATPTAIILRAKVFLTAIAVTAVVALVAFASWPLKVLVVLVFVRGLFASDLVSLRNAPRPWYSSRRPERL